MAVWVGGALGTGTCAGALPCAVGVLSARIWFSTNLRAYCGMGKSVFDLLWHARSLSLCSLLCNAFSLSFAFSCSLRLRSSAAACVLTCVLACVFVRSCVILMLFGFCVGVRVCCVVFFA